METFLLSASFSGEHIARCAAHCKTSAIQIVQHLDPLEYRHLMDLIRHVRRVQVIHVADRSVLDLIHVYEPLVHAFILDGGQVGASIAELGGTGRVHDWSVSAEFVRLTCKPVFLAGGLHSQNIQHAISTVTPYGVDLCTGVRRNNKLDPRLLEEFTRTVNDHLN